MFVGHLGLAFAAKRARPRVSLGWYVTAVLAVDLLWPFFLLAGIERVRIVPGATAFTPLIFDRYPWTHSLVMGVAWGVLLAALARWRGIARGTAGLIGLLVVSHWVLDWVTHAPDLPLWPGRSPHLGLGLWNSVPATLVIEGAIWVAGLWLYLAPRRRTSWRGPAALWSLVLIATTLWGIGPWGPPPPDPHALALFALISWLLVPWSAAADRHYALRTRDRPAGYPGSPHVASGPDPAQWG